MNPEAFKRSEKAEPLGLEAFEKPYNDKYDTTRHLAAPFHEPRPAMQAIVRQSSDTLEQGLSEIAWLA